MSILSLFGNKSNSNGKQSVTEAMFNAVSNNINSLILPEKNAELLSKVFLGTESFEAKEEAFIGSGASSLKDNAARISEAYTDATGRNLTENQLDSLHDSLLMAQEPKAYIKSSERTSLPEGAIISGLGGEPDVGLVNAELAQESYETHGMLNTMSMTVSYNIRPEKQSPAVELFFETVSLDSSTNTYTLDVHTTSVFNAREYEVSGNRDAWRNQKHIIRALADHNILKSEFTKITPVYRQDQSSDNFVDAALMPPSVYTTDYGEDVLTSLLKIGRDIKLLDISQTDRMITLGMQNFTDQVAPNPRLKTLGLKVGDEMVVFNNLQHHQESTFTYATKGDREGIQLNYLVNTHLLGPDTKAHVSKALPTKLQALADKNLEVLLRFDVVGRGNTNTSDFTINAASVKVHRVRDNETKEEKNLNDPDIKALVAEIEKESSIVGWDIDAQRTNANLREHGLVLTDNVTRIIYGVQLHAPISIVRPIDDKDSVSDSQRIDSLIKATFIRRTNAGITALFDILNMLNNLPKNLNNTETFGFSTVGIGQFFIKPYVRDLKLDVFQVVQSMQTSDRLNNVHSVMTNLLLAEMTKAYAASEMAAVYELTDFSPEKPHVIAIADVFTHKFLFREGDARSLGDGFDFTSKECTDKRLIDGGLVREEWAGRDMEGEVGTIFASFGRPKTGSLKLPMIFGQTLDKREIPRIVTRSRGSAHSHEVMVQPWFSHICHLPLLIRIVVTGLDRAIRSRVPFAVQEMTP